MPWVWALNALQNSMMLRPRWPSAGPIGGDGFALPAGTCSLMKPTTFFAMSCPQLRGAVRPWLASRVKSTKSDFLDLRIFQLDRGGAAKDRHRHLESCLLLV